MSENDLLAEIDVFLSGTSPRMSDTAFGKAAINDGKFVHQLRAGKRRVWPETAERVRAFIRESAGVRAIGNVAQTGAAA